MFVPDQKPLVIGHRGAAGLSPENTLPSFARAYELGVRAVELDVQVVEDELVVIHDDTLDRTTNGTGPVADQPLAALRKLDAGGGEQIPTLAEVWRAAPAHVGVNVELKGPDTARPTLDWLAQIQPLSGQIMVSSFDHEELGRFAVDAPEGVVIAPLFHLWNKRCVDIARFFNTRWLNINHRVLTEKRLAALAGEQMLVCAYTVNTLSMGPTPLLTDIKNRFAHVSLCFS